MMSSSTVLYNWYTFSDKRIGEERRVVVVVRERERGAEGEREAG